MNKQYISPLCEAQLISVGQLMAGSGTTIEKGDPLNGGGQGGIIVG